MRNAVMLSVWMWSAVAPALAGAVPAAPAANPFPATSTLRNLASETSASKSGQLPALFKELSRPNSPRLVVAFGGSWCGPCRAHYPDLVALAATETTSRFVFVALEHDDPEWAELNAAVSLMFTNGRPVALPLYAIVTRGVAPRVTLTTPNVKVLADRLRTPVATGDPADTTSDGGAKGSVEALGATLQAQVEIQEANTAADIAAALSEATGVPFMLEPRLASSPLMVRGSNSVGAWIETVTGLTGARVATLPREGAQPAVAFWLPKPPPPAAGPGASGRP
jgi:thiol-disulfide isomerase/thioredoxin